MTRDLALASEVERWFRAEGRDLPWRTSPRDPWGSLVSEAMLQQTQVSRVVERFGAFMARFPTPAALARASEDEALAAWKGLGYYRRARNLQKAARAIGEEFGGVVPARAAELRRLPGVGRYTAGAVSSIVFGEREPIVDGNVARVLVRIGGKAMRAGARETETWAWRRAGELVAACGDPAALNEGLMELGAVVCTPRNPACGACPVRGWCSAARSGAPGAYPLPKAAAAKREAHHAVVVVRDAAGRVLIEKRPETGLWAGMWQPVGMEGDGVPPTAGDLARARGVESASLVAGLVHETTHRRVRLSVWTGTAAEAAGAGAWVSGAELDAYAMSSVHRRVVEAGLGRDRSR